MRLIIRISIFLFLFSCTKDGKNITVRGRIYNPVTGEGISDCEIRLLKTTSGSPGNSGSYEAVATVTPDADGYYELNHTSIFGRYMGCYFDTDKYDEIGWVKDGSQTFNVSFEKVKLGRITDLDCQAIPFGQLLVNFDNINCEGASDEMQFRIKTHFETEYSSWSPVLSGCYSFTASSPGKVPMGYRYYQMKVTRPSGTYYVYDTVYIPETGVAQLDLFY